MYVFALTHTLVHAYIYKWQMPRGNLEAVYPRPLVLHAAARMLDAGRYVRGGVYRHVVVDAAAPIHAHNVPPTAHTHTQYSKHRYGQALALLRRQNGDLNFLVDYDPLRFEREGCRLLVEQVNRYLVRVCDAMG